MTIFQQIGREPGEIEIRTVEETEVAGRDEPHVLRGEDALPRHCLLFRGMDGGVRRTAVDIGQLGLVDVGMLLRAIAVQDGKGDRPHDAQQRERIEHPAPAERRHDGNGEERRRGDRKPAEAMRDPLNEAALFLGKPKLHGARRGRKRASFAEAEHEAHAEQRDETAGQSGCRRHNRPERDDRQ